MASEGQVAYVLKNMYLLINVICIDERHSGIHNDCFEIQMYP